MADFGVPTAGQLDKINALAHITLSPDRVFSFHTKMIGDGLLEDRLIQLHKTLLEVFKNDAKTGIAFMLDHPWAGFMRPKAAYPYGRTYDATLKKSDGTLEGENWALCGDTYIVRGKEKDGISTDGIIADIEDGTLFDMSIGFGFKNSTCSICGHEYYSDECQHWRGQQYDGQLCYIIAKPPGYLMELSGVFDGAYPTAGVLSQVGLSESQSDFVQLPDEELKKLPSGIMTYASYGSASGKLLTYHKKDDLVKGNAFNVGGLTMTTGCLNVADLRDGTAISENAPDALKKNLQSLSSLKGSDQKMSEDLLKMLTGLGITVAEGAEAPTSDTVFKILSEKWQKENPPVELEFTAEYMTQAQVIEKFGKELPAEKVLSYAKDGETYRNELIEEALKMGVRAQAEAFKKDTWERNFDLLSIQDIKDTMDTWSKQAGEEIPSGRQSSAGAGQGAVTQSELPDEAFQA